jgi:hypothetical protein
MRNDPFVSPFGVRHGTQIIHLGPDDIERILHGSTIEFDVLGEYVAEISYDPTSKPHGKPLADLDAEFFPEHGWPALPPSGFLTPVAEVAVRVGVEIDSVRDRVRAAGFALSKRHPEAGWPDGGIVTADLPAILELFDEAHPHHDGAGVAAYAEAFDDWERLGEGSAWDGTAGDGLPALGERTIEGTVPGDADVSPDHLDAARAVMLGVKKRLPPERFEVREETLFVSKGSAVPHAVFAVLLVGVPQGLISAQFDIPVDIDGTVDGLVAGLLEKNPPKV